MSRAVPGRYERGNALARVRRAADKLDAAYAARDQALLDAHALGASLRAIAEATGLGVETVRRIVKGAS